MPHGEQTVTTWRAEGQAMLEAGLELQRIAITLPVDSEVRGDLLAEARDWFGGARLRGAAPSAT